MARNGKRKHGRLPDSESDSSSAGSDDDDTGLGTVSLAAAKKRPAWWRRPNSKLTPAQKLRKQATLRKEALLLLSGLHPLAKREHRVPAANVRPTPYSVPTPVVPDEPLTFKIVNGTVKAQADRAPPPPPGNYKHFATLRGGESLKYTEEKLLKQWCEPRIHQFKDNANVVHCDVIRSQLGSRERTAENLATAEERVKIMQANPDKYIPICTSTIVKDASRNPEGLAFYFATDPLAFDKKRMELSMQNKVLTEDALDDLVREMPSSSHGIPPKIVLHFCERGQEIVALFGPPVKDPDNSSRHRAAGLSKDSPDSLSTDEETDSDVDAAPTKKKAKKKAKKKKPKKNKVDVITDEEQEYARLVHDFSYIEYDLDASLRETFDLGEQLRAFIDAGVDVPEEFFTKFKENIAVLHFSHCWHESGKRTTDHMTPSSDMHGDKSSTRQGAVRSYHLHTTLVRSWIDRCFKACVPNKDYKAYSKAYEAGRVLGDKVPGPFLTQVIIWKCDSRTHRDSNDGHGAWCVTFNGGNFDGGVIYFPDLWLCFRYKPGDLLIFRSSDLYHCVGPWTPKAMKAGDTITPGRIAFVFFSPCNTMRVLRGKPKDWFVDTTGGHYEQECERRPRKKQRTK